MEFETLPRRKKIKGISFLRDPWGNYVPENRECLPSQATIKVRSPADCLPVLATIRMLRQECFMAVTLNGTNHIIKAHEITVGLANQSQVHPRETFVCALEDRAVGIIIAHNHPSGSLDPSADDLLVTRRLADSGKVLGIPLLDHLIVSENGWTSLRERFPDYFQAGLMRT